MIKRVTKKFILARCRLNPKAIPGCVIENNLEIYLDANEHQSGIKDKVIDKLLKLDWIKDKGRLVLTQNGYNSIHTRY